MSSSANPEPAAADVPDEQLLRAVAAGNEHAFRILYRRHSPRIRALIGRMLGWHSADTEDALQETWIRAVTRLGTFSRDSSLSTWLSGIGINVSWELVRKRQRDMLSESSNEGPFVTALTVERIDLEGALARLPDTQRIVVVLHDVEGYTHDEIAKHLGVAAGTSKSHLFRARKALRSMLESYARIP